MLGQNLQAHYEDVSEDEDVLDYLSLKRKRWGVTPPPKEAKVVTKCTVTNDIDEETRAPVMGPLNMAQVITSGQAKASEAKGTKDTVPSCSASVAMMPPARLVQ